ncbi:unnamed protein product [Cuscuta campestris]|uniref:Uncharacterized protein n=1 Tax=Cuscuta campestris TaxID=132261 RepID=A0A484N5D1_9ASTE|nr:unnamed protein product [Cuscuta campestris]
MSSFHPVYNPPSMGAPICSWEEAVFWAQEAMTFAAYKDGATGGNFYQVLMSSSSGGGHVTWLQFPYTFEDSQRYFPLSYFDYIRVRR